MKSDIWALGCILCELVSGRKLFSNDFRLLEYVVSKQKLDLPPLADPMDERTTSYVSQFLHNMLEIDWWRRPKAQEILQAISSLSQETTQVYIFHEDPALFHRRLHLYYKDEHWKEVLWKQYW